MKKKQSTLKSAIIKIAIYLGIFIASSLGYISFARKLLLPHADDIAYAHTIVMTKQGIVKCALFSPDDDIERVLIGLIAAEQNHIQVAIFSMTNKAITQALIAAHKRGILVEMVADRSNAQNSWSKIKQLGRAGIELYTYPADLTEGIMHHKFIIFSNTIDNKQVLVTGSYNLTNSASSRNEENVIILDDKDLIAPFGRQFELLKRRSIAYESCMR